MISVWYQRKKISGNYYGIKMESNLNTDALERLASDALAQIDAKRYDFEMTEEGIKNILKLGIAFSGKQVKIKTE